MSHIIPHSTCMGPAPCHLPSGRVAAVIPPGRAGPLPFGQMVSMLDTMPGVDHRGAEALVAEWGTDMGRFGTASRLAAWTGVAPGNDESAGRQQSGKTRQGHRVLRAALIQLAHAAARTKGTYLSALYQRLAARRGKKRALGRRPRDRRQCLP
jgi:transposase